MDVYILWWTSLEGNSESLKSRDGWKQNWIRIWLRMGSLGETCGIVKWIPETVSRQRSSLVVLKLIHGWMNRKM